MAIDPQDVNTIYGSSTVFPGPETFFFRSTDSGVTWTKLAPAPKPGFLRAFAIDPANSSTLFVAGDAGVFKSTDEGVTWSESGSGLPILRSPEGRLISTILNILIHPQKPGTLFALISLGNGAGIFKSTDGAETWSEVNPGFPGQGPRIDILEMDPRDSDTLYAAARDVTPGPPLIRLFKSTNAGSSWNLVNANVPITSLTIDPQTPGVLYASFVNFFASAFRGVFKSTDGGESWSQIFSLPANWVVVAPADQPSNPGAAPDRQSTSVYAGIGAFGIFKSADGGISWAASNSGLKATSIAAVAVSPRDPASVYVGVSGAGPFNSTDGGDTWSWGGLGGNIISLMPQSSGTLYANVNGGAFKTTDEGANWTPLGVSGILAIDPVDPQTLYAYGAFKSTDGGASWVKLVIPESPFIAALAISPQNPRTLYAAASKNNTYQVFKSLDGGASWTTTTISNGSFFWKTLTVDPQNPMNVYAAFACDEYYNVCTGAPLNFKSRDGGATWDKWDLPPASSVLTFDAQGAIYANDQSGLLKSVDRGETWNRVTASGLTFLISALAVDPMNPNHLFAGTFSAGVFEITLTPEEQ